MDPAEDSIVAAPSDDSGNVPAEDVGNVPEPTPSELPGDGEDQPDGSKQGETPEVTGQEPELYELPDGRKVDAATLSKEWKENFLPEFTRKSQELAAKNGPEQNINTPTQKPYEDPNWNPKDWPEVINIAKAEVRQDLEREERERADQRKALEDRVVTELAEIKKADPNLNENALFLHANEYRQKYGVAFPTLTAAYNHMIDVQKLTKSVQQTTAKNIAKRADPVSVPPGTGATGQRPDPSMFGSAVEYLRSLK